MKTFILSTIFLLIGTSVSLAQFNQSTDTDTDEIVAKKSKFFVGGSINYVSSENISPSIFFNGSIPISGNIIEGSTSTSYSLNPTLGCQLNKHWILGFNFQLTKNKNEINNDFNGRQEQEITGNSAGIYLRYIFNPEQKIQGYISPYYLRTNSENKFIIPDFQQEVFISEQSSNNFGINLGAQYSVRNWLRLTTQIGGFHYVTGTTKNPNFNNFGTEIDFKSSGFNFRGSSIFFGIEFMF